LASNNILPGFLFRPTKKRHHKEKPHCFLMYQLLSDLLLLFSASARRLLFPFLVPRSRQEWEMIIKFNEIYIYINRSGETQKVHICFIHSKSHVASHLRRNSSRRLKAFSESAPAPTSPPHSSLHRLLLHVIEIETSVKLGLFLGTKESDILE